MASNIDKKFGEGSVSMEDKDEPALEKHASIVEGDDKGLAVRESNGRSKESKSDEKQGVDALPSPEDAAEDAAIVPGEKVASKKPESKSKPKGKGVDALPSPEDAAEDATVVPGKKVASKKAKPKSKPKGKGSNPPPDPGADNELDAN